MVSLFNIDTIILLLCNGMPKIPHKIKVPKAILRDKAIDMQIQFFKCRLRRCKRNKLLMQSFFHKQAIAPFFILDLIYIINDLAVFENNRAGIIAPDIIALRTEVNRDNVILSDQSVRCDIFPP